MRNNSGMCTFMCMFMRTHLPCCSIHVLQDTTQQKCKRKHTCRLSSSTILWERRSPCSLKPMPCLKHRLPMANGVVVERLNDALPLASQPLALAPSHAA